MPEYTIDDSGIMVCCNAGEDYIRLLNDSVIDNGVKDVAKGVVKELSDIDIQLLEMMANNPRITAAEAAKLLDISLRTTQRHISYLKAYGMIERIGGKKSGKWILSIPNK